ncbi:hypothetical protein [Mycolicibacterium sphagni]|uniref:Lipoprotein n=1 Tax=Mycolicibacterium sphagni TaxID=1786 RepID=A0A255DBP4_9MYCO|nr:hypothetical protein [Mycolicibacterium sphagni]MCV7178068.1 hypothetical protein [Mycolicibacterium sphagni]OYN76520.1 hypothetical protein CG716_21780 [Mycolicibacterium sphagni]
MNRTARRLGAAVVLAGVAAVSLPGCSPSGSSTSASSTTTTATTNAPASSATAPVADCTKAGLADAATKAVQAVAKDNLYRIDDVKCADAWAVTSGLWSSKANPDMGAPSTLVFQQQGTQWVGQDKQKVCGTNASTTPAPADAKIPAALYEFGCLTG